MDEQPGADAIDLGIPGLTDAVAVGHGGYSTVYRCNQPAYRRTVAVKVLSVPLADEQSRRAFERECQTLGSLSAHPHIVTLFAAGVATSGRPYLIMEHLAGGSMAERLRSNGPLQWPEATVIGVKLAGALATAHAAGVLHGDIKPENVLVSPYGEPKLADFGVARLLDATRTATDRITVSLIHAAPEVLSGVPAAEPADIWSLASTVATLMAGSAPFAHEGEQSAQALVTRILTAPTPDLRPLGVPDPICVVLEAGLMKAPEERLQSAEVFGERLQQAQSSLGQAPTVMAVNRAPAVGADQGPNDSSHAGAPRSTTKPAVSRPDARSSIAGWSLRHWPLIAAAAAVLVLAGAFALAMSAGHGQVRWTGDSFAGPRIDRAHWRVAQSPGATVEERGPLVITLSAGAPAAIEAGVLTSTCSTAADFDVQVDYALTDWPPENQGRLAIIAGPVLAGAVSNAVGADRGVVAPQRISTPQGEFYAMNLSQAVYPDMTISPPGSIVGQATTTQQSGQLRVSRRYNTYIGYQRRLPTEPWTIIAVAPKDVIGPTAFSLQVWADRPARLQAAFTNFKILAGRCVS